MRAYRYDFSSMGCPCAIHLEHDDARRAEDAARAAEREVHRLDHKYSHYRDASLVGAIAAAAARGETIEVDAETADLLDFVATLHAQSEGRFDITAGALTRLWDPQRGVVPEPHAVAAALAITGWDKVQWRRPALALTVPGMRLDLGGVVKEYAADRAAAVCRAAGASSGIVDLGGDLAVVGPHADGSAWRIGIKDPRDPARPSAEFDLVRGGLATSGDYERAMVVDGVRYSHIVDVRSGVPVRSYASITVVADSCLVAGAASTLAMLFGRDGAGPWLESLGLPYLCIDADGRRSGSVVS